jgi:predicted SAM-dependent methyltransferase
MQYYNFKLIMDLIKKSDRVNIALGKFACQSSLSQWSKSPESLLNINGKKSGEFFFHTENEQHAWWQIDLDNIYPLSSIEVFNRGSAGSELADRANSMAVFISADGMQWEKIYSGGKSFGGSVDNNPLIISCLENTARFVRLQLQEKNFLHLEEVRIFTNSVNVIRRLHIGGKISREGWEVINALPGAHVDHLGNANDLSRFANNTFETLYASHVVEHLDYTKEMIHTLVEWHRVLRPNGIVMISVPDLEILSAMILNKQLTQKDRLMAMYMIFGGHTDEYDYHYVGLTEEFLGDYLSRAGFVNIERVNSFGLFNDCSELKHVGQAISLNMKASKPASN